ncbi:IclR family transcriptional regulator [Streptomyces mangrovisoli]|uniref:IclR family transcriptional regulator n=1 Tax=Streptomyces mangrovisoli TaxID=1428628 RepID=A0A1J4NRS5_9ACTN|nr:IclR family transcriptional regulator [Streptomyces mangrovisoli]OIJ64284.1 IclR family transcriptional regulator [Streptomyces mangrovisoli]
MPDAPQPDAPQDGRPAARSAVDKALDLVEAVSRAPHPVRLTDLAAEVDLHRATAYRILLDLVRRGWVLRAGDRYLPGPAVLRMSASAAGNSLTALARPVMERLSARTSMMVNLQVLEDGGSRVIDVVRPERLAMISHLRGEFLPVRRFAGPLALVAALEPEARQRWLGRLPEAEGPQARTLSGELAEVERTGVAVEHGRNEKVVASLSRAVVPTAGAPVCALTVVGPDAEFDATRLADCERELRRATDELETALTAGSDTSGGSR